VAVCVGVDPAQPEEEVVRNDSRDAAGALSDCIGARRDQKCFMSLVVGKAELNMMRTVKKVLDPNNVVNPGKIFVLP